MVDVKEHLSYDVFKTPWGWVGVAFTTRGLRRLVLPRPDRAAVAGELSPPAGAVLTRLVEFRQQHVDRIEKDHGIRITYMPFLIAAACRALKPYFLLCSPRAS